jgi:hypothetical protein
LAVNLRSNIFNLLLAMVFVVGTPNAGAQEAPPVPSGIVLNGITTILGDNRALFKVSFTAGASGAGFMLAEGQTRYGIQLLAVNTQSNTATIRHQGRTQIIPICPTPTLLDGTAAANRGVASGKFRGRNKSGMMIPAGSAPASENETQPAAEGQLVQSGHGGSGGASSGSLPNDASGNDNHSAPGNSDNNTIPVTDSGASGPGSAGDNGSPAPVYQWWIKEAQKIEQARQETAQRVTAGEWPAYPLTPLTPAGTPAQLIGADSVFMDHGPGVVLAHD